MVLPPASASPLLSHPCLSSGPAPAQSPEASDLAGSFWKLQAPHCLGQQRFRPRADQGRAKGKGRSGPRALFGNTLGRVAEPLAPAVTVSRPQGKKPALQWTPRAAMSKKSLRVVH